MNIRPATPADVPQVLPMVRKIAAFHQGIDPAKYTYKSDPGEMYRDWLGKRATDARSVFLVADAAGRDEATPRIAGFLVATVEREIGIYAIAEYGFIHDVWVDDKYRNEGAARQMMTLAI